MQEQFGVRGTVAEDVFFTESEIPDAEVIRHVRVEISRQNANLGQVKARLAVQAREIGATAIMNFRYGEKAHSRWQLIKLKWDTESWHGEGDAVTVRGA